MISIQLANVALLHNLKVYNHYTRNEGSRVCNLSGFPCNQFGGQEPGSGEEAAQNCKLNYGVTSLCIKK